MLSNSMFPQKEMGGGSNLNMYLLLSYIFLKEKKKIIGEVVKILYTVRMLRVD